MKKTVSILLLLCLMLSLCAASALAEEPAQGKALLGVTVYNEVDGGVLVMELVPDSPAEKSGMRPGDVITAVNGLPVADSDALVAASEALEDGVPFTLDVLRRGSPCTVTVYPGDEENIGLYIAEGSAPVGVTVLEINPDGPAEKAGIQAGDVVVAFNGKTIVFTEDLVEAVQSCAPGDAVEIELLRDGGRRAVIAVLCEAEPEKPAEEPIAAEAGAASLRVADLPFSVEVREGSSGALLTVCAEGALDEDASFIWYKLGKDGISYPMDSFFLPKPELLGLSVENSYDAEKNVYISTLCANEITAAASGTYFCRVLDVNGAELDSSSAALSVR